MNALALQEPGSNLKGSVTDRPLPGQSFVWLPFAGGDFRFRGHPAKAHGKRLPGRDVSGRVAGERMRR
jgi:hypothetical protein